MLRKETTDMSLLEPRCLVCGAPLNKGAPFEKDVRLSEVCSDKCYQIYTTDEDEENEMPRPTRKENYEIGLRPGGLS